MASISHRKYIQWHPDEASEPTSTLVLQSPQQRFVDLRILLPPDGESTKLSNDPTGLLPLERLDWAIAGTSTSKLVAAPSSSSGESIRRATFSHWISSRDADPAGVSDEGDMYPQPDGTTLERGAMLNPATGRVASYDELWVDLSPAAGERSAVLTVDAGAVRGMVVLVGAFCQGLVRDAREGGGGGGGVSLERWERRGHGRDDGDGAQWVRTVRMGARELPCESVVTGKVRLEKDGAVACHGDMWKVVEV